MSKRAKCLVLLINRKHTAYNKLPSGNFLQVHKSFAVALKHIKSVEGNQIVIGGQAIPIGKMYRSVVIQLLK